MTDRSPNSCLVACLCAAWCRTCDSYRALLAERARQEPGWRFAWVDIEDHADALDDARGAADDIQTFPTLLIARGADVLYFGPVLPQAQVLVRLLQRAREGALPPLTDPAALRMARAVGALVQACPDGVRL